MLCHHWVKVTINVLNPVVRSFLLRQLNRVRKFRDASLAIKLITSAAKSENIFADDLSSVLQKILLDGTWLLSNVLHLSKRENRNAIQLLYLLLEKNSRSLEIIFIPEGSGDPVQIESQSPELQKDPVKIREGPTGHDNWFLLGNFRIISLQSHLHYFIHVFILISIFLFL
jgi:hypothetical protein